MKRARFTEEQIIAVLKGHETGVKTADLARKHGISEATFYNWKAKYGGMDVSEARRLKVLEDENAKLKKLRGMRYPASEKAKIVWTNSASPALRSTAGMTDIVRAALRPGLTTVPDQIVSGIASPMMSAAR
jgi:putative transposase